MSVLLNLILFFVCVHSTQFVLAKESQCTLEELSNNCNIFESNNDTLNTDKLGRADLNIRRLEKGLIPSEKILKHSEFDPVLQKKTEDLFKELKNLSKELLKENANLFKVKNLENINSRIDELDLVFKKESECRFDFENIKANKIFDEAKNKQYSSEDEKSKVLGNLLSSGEMSFPLAQNIRADVINLCPAVANGNLNSLIRILSHEIGHAFEPCNTFHQNIHFAKSKYNYGDLLKIMKKNKKLFSQQDASWIKASHGNILNRAVDNKKLIADETIAFLKENDIITNISQPIVGEFKPIVDCIQSEVLLNTEKIDSSSYLSMEEMCSGKFEEVFSDWWSIELTNYYLERALPKKSTSNTFSPDPRAFVSSLLSFGCSKNNFIQEEAYLPLPDRIKFIFSHPKLNTKFNCQKTPLSSFEKCLYSKNGMPSPKPLVDAIK